MEILPLDILDLMVGESDITIVLQIIDLVLKHLPIGVLPEKNAQGKYRNDHDVVYDPHR